MPLAATVSLPREFRVQFPRRCIVCGASHPITTARLVARDGMKGAALWAGWFAVDVPCCGHCRLALHAIRLGRSALTLLIAAGALAFGIAVLQHVLPGWVTGLIVLGICGIAFFAQAAWSILRPPPFSIDPHDRYVDYEFRDPALAEEFARINGADPTSM